MNFKRKSSDMSDAVFHTANEETEILTEIQQSSRIGNISKGNYFLHCIFVNNEFTPI